MEQLLTINNGNTSSTVGIFQDGLKEIISLKELSEENKKNITHVMTSQVGSGFETWAGPKFISLKELIKENSLLGMPINYAETLGEDRLAGSYWVYKNFIQARKAQRVMLIDAGTFTTLDLITTDGFEGGHIFPGTETLLKSFSNGTQLPRLRVKEMGELVGLPKSTDEAIYGSVQMAERGLIEKWWDRFRPELIVLSGGLSFWHKKYLPSEIILEPNIVHLGLYDAFKDMSH